MLESTSIEQLRASYIELWKLVDQYGHGQNNGILNMIEGQVRCIDSEKNQQERTQYLVDGYKRIFFSRGGLGDFVIFTENSELRSQLNEKFNGEIEKIWKILKPLIKG